MKYIIYLIVILVVLWGGRNYIKGFIQNFLDKRNKRKIPEVKNDLVYTPVQSSRTFYFAIQIDEVGDGKASITIIKPKDLQ